MKVEVKDIFKPILVVKEGKATATVAVATKKKTQVVGLENATVPVTITYGNKTDKPVSVGDVLVWDIETGEVTNHTPIPRVKAQTTGRATPAHRDGLNGR